MPESFLSWRLRKDLELIGGHPDTVTLFRKEDADAWLVLSLAFCALLTLDLCFLSRWKQSLTLKSALLMTLCWVLCGAAFNGYVFFRFGEMAAWQWASAYVLEWLLSFDNLFVFHSIFSMYKTPESMRHKPLFIGIMGAVVFRLGFLFVGEYLMHVFWYAHLGFGALLVVTGVRSAMDDDDEDVADNAVVRLVTRNLPIVQYYSPDGAFFIKEKVHPPAPEYGAVEPARAEPKEAWRGTLLLLVVVCIEVADLVFAVDSVSAVVAQVNTLFLAYSAVVFAMLGLRAGYFVIDTLAHTFELFKYGISAILVFIGVKLIFSKVFYIPPTVVCMILVGTLATSVVLSVVVERVREAHAAKAALATPRIPGIPTKL
jgi:tellurite resistance protein TerC